MGRLEGQVAIVTGGALGIGGATARRFAEEGAKVLVADVVDDAAAKNVETIRAAGGIAEEIHTDVSAHADIKAMIDRAVELWGRLDILVNNAYGAPEGARATAVDLAEDVWDKGMAMLVKSMFLGAKYAVPEMQKAGGGNIVNLSSVHGYLMARESLLYEAGKSAVIGVTKQMACDFGPIGVRVNAICPGHIVTERQQRRWDDMPSGLRFFEDQYPLRRTGVPMDIANAIVFLCSEEASFITGHALVVDGGMTIQLQENLGVQQGHFIQAHPDTQLPY